MTRIPNPELAVGPDNKQWWNRAANRRFGFHNAHTLFRRAHMVRARNVLPLVPAPDPAPDPALSDLPGLARLIAAPEISALVCARGDRILFDHAAPDFASDRPHSIQSITKMHLHLLVGRLLERGLIDLDRPVSSYLPEIGSGYAAAPIRDLLDMNLCNDFTEDYADPLSDCYAQEVAIGWRLPAEGTAEITMRDFVRAITGSVLYNPGGRVQYKSANSDVLTLICARLCPRDLRAEIEAIADAAGYAGAFHISLSPEGLPAFSGGGCLSAKDLARFGLLLHRIAQGRADGFGNRDFLLGVPSRDAPEFDPPRAGLRYSRHLMTDGRFVGHAGYGGQFLMVDLVSGVVCACLGVVGNEAGHDADYTSDVIATLKTICHAVPHDS